MKITLKAARVNQGIGAAEAAKLLGITRNTLYTYEEGQVMPRADILQKMLEIYKIDIKKLKLCSVMEFDEKTRWEKPTVSQKRLDEAKNTLRVMLIFDSGKLTEDEEVAIEDILEYLAES